MTTRILSFFLLIFLFAGCDKYYEAESIIENNTSKSITVRYQIDYYTIYYSDSIYETTIGPYNKKSIFHDPSSHGMKCEDVRSNQEKIYFLNIHSITNSSNDTCLKAYNDCSEWKYESEKREDEFDLITYSLILDEDDF